MKFKRKIAVVSMAGIFPGADQTTQFIKNILENKTAVITVPPERWVAPASTMVCPVHTPDRAISDKAGLIINFQFDPLGFRVDKDLLASLDPVHHLVLGAARKALASCHITKELEQRTGVILAAIALPTDTAAMVSKEILCVKNPRSFSPVDAARASVVSGPAAILARAMGFNGGSFTLDAACASSLYAIKLACEHLSLKKADLMVAGGVSRPDPLYTQVGFTQLKALSPTGCCAPFDKNANGLVVGEGAGILVLKRLDDAIACGDTIHAVITGTGASNDLEGNLVGPASEGQIRAMEAAYNQAGWTPADIQYMECHGSGTPVGDQVEALSIKTLLDRYGCPDKPLSIGSIKSMIGHLLTAAGAAGFIKTVLAMEKGCLPPSLNFTALPDKSPLNQTQVRVQEKSAPWEPEQPDLPRKAGISAFGFGGINAHILVEEFSDKPLPHFVPRGTASEEYKAVPCAIVGMETISGNADNLGKYTELILGKFRPKTPEPRTRQPGTRWRRTRHLSRGVDKLPTAFMDDLSVELGQFHIPPNQMEDILPQHLIMLKAAKGALEDACIPPRPLKTESDRTSFGCAIGIEFDFGATDFSLRWQHHLLDKTLLNQLSPELTFNRTLGALGGIVASRIAREFKLGGPCFTLSAGAASGIKSIETAVHSLSSHETNTFLCGCVDLAGDIRAFTLNQAANPDGQTIPSEGACALVLKRLDDALRDKDRIYGIIKGIAGSGGAMIPGEPREPVEPSPANISGKQKKSNRTSLARQYVTSFNRGLTEAATHFSDLAFIGTHSMGVGYQGEAEARALSRMAASHKGVSLNLSCTASTIGDTQGASGLFSIIGAALCLYHQILPGNPLPVESKFNGLDGFIAPDPCQTWQPIQGKPRKAAVCVITKDGACAHAILEESSPEKSIPGESFPKETREKALSFPEPPLSPKAQKARTHPTFRISTSRPPIPEEMVDKMIDEVTGKLQKAISFQKSGDTPETAPIVFPTEPMVPVPLAPDPMPKTPLVPEPVVPQAGPLAEDPIVKQKVGPNIFGDAGHITTRAHEKFLEFTSQNMAQMEHQFAALVRATSKIPGGTPAGTSPAPKKATPPPSVFLDRDKCLEYAIGKAGNVLGPEFDIIDTYPVRVRLPAEPLMLVDRIMDIQGEMLSLSSGKIVTQHDVQEHAWYLDGGKAPVSISIEAGQADLFLCAYLGIDHAVKGKRKYRLLDAKVTFHRPLPSPGDTIEYHIEIDRFLKQGEIYLFFFHYKGYIDNQLFISMKEGCAGFFTEAEVENSGGILLKKEDTKKIPPGFIPPVLAPVEQTAFPKEKMDALRQGDLETAFGPHFKGITLGKNQWLPDGRMRLIDRVIELDPLGGRYGLGTISAEADIHPDNWFLTCHFIDDMVMPGTLMYECCAHTLRVFVQRMGWVSEADSVHFDVLSLNESDLKCRGPVTRETRVVRYTIEIKEIGYNPAPYVIADAHMFSDDLQIVLYKNMGMTLSNITLDDLKRFWRKK
jgi:acyl transferase domain-containing protein/3-hydroxymyristoyl/3-hydroxydecanoyl-(acyl carrier protein) dehydratase